MAEQSRVNRSLVSIAQIVGWLGSDPNAAKEFARDPEAFLKLHGFSPQDLEVGQGEETLARARRALDKAELGENETLSTALPKLSKSAAEVFGSDYRVEVEPFAVRFLEQPALLSFRWTMTGHIRCTFDGWDGCSVGLDW